MKSRTATEPGTLVIVVIGCLFILGGTSTAEAQKFELTPFGGWRFGGEFAEVGSGYGNEINLDESPSFGLILGIPWDPIDRSSLELVWSHQGSSVDLTTAGGSTLDLNVDYLHIGGMAPFSTPNEKIETLLSGGLGATYMQAGSSSSSSEIRFSLSFGAGLLFHVSERVAVRLEARGWYTFTETGSAIFCSGGCVVAFSGTGFVQGELTAGLQLSF